jgi:hypothetical protein
MQVTEFSVEHFSAFVDLQRKTDRPLREHRGEMGPRCISQGGSGRPMHGCAAAARLAQVQVAECIVTGTIGYCKMCRRVGQYARPADREYLLVGFVSHREHGVGQYAARIRGNEMGQADLLGLIAIAVTIVYMYR